MMKVNILETDTGRILEDELRDWSQAALQPTRQAYRLQVLPSRPARSRQHHPQRPRPGRRHADRQWKKRLLPASRDA